MSCSSKLKTSRPIVRTQEGEFCLSCVGVVRTVGVTQSCTDTESGGLCVA